MKESWNERYAGREYIYGKQPNELLRAYLENKDPGTILFPSEGEGRNAVFAAKKGWVVYAVDFSEVAQQKASDWARINNVWVNYHVADLTDWKCKLNFDCIALIYAHYDPEYREHLHKKFVALLKKDGEIILESFSKKQIEYDSGGPKNIGFLYDESTLRSDFNALKIEFLQERIIRLEEGSYHKGDASVIRMIAKNTKT